VTQATALEQADRDTRVTAAGSDVPEAVGKASHLDGIASSANLAAFVE